MKSTDYTYKGYDITIYEKEKSFTVDVRKPDGDLMAGWYEIDTFMHAGSKAQEFIDNLQGE
jgi:hypothetical protein